MSINAQDLLDRARRVIQDETSVRWPLPELRLWLNDALREISLVKPTAYSDSIVFPLAVGTYQKLPATYSSVTRVIRNLKTAVDAPRAGGDAIRVVDRTILDAHDPNWHDSSRVKYRKTVRNVCFDASEPRAFFVYPGNDGTGIVEATVVRIPTPIPAPATAADQIASYNYTVDVLDIYANAVVDYMLYRAYSKDSQFAGSAQRAMAYYAAFSNALGVAMNNERARNLNTKVSTQEENAA